jgi:hypothetical protein
VVRISNGFWTVVVVVDLLWGLVKQGEWFMLGTRREKMLRKLAKRVAERRGTVLPVNRSPG